MDDPFEAVPLLDRLKILDRMARYSWALDRGDMAAYLDGFTEDAWIEHPLPDGAAHRFTGHDEIRGWLGGNFDARPHQTFGHQHQFNAVLMTPDGEDVWVDAYILIFRHEFHRRYWPAGPSFRMGTWRGRFRRTGLDWRLSGLEVRMWTDTALGAGAAVADRPVGAPGVR